MKEYMAVSGPQSIHVGKGDTQAAFDLFAGIINEKARMGWTYHSMEAITVSQKQGCMQPPLVVNYYMLIFEREV